MKPVLVLPLMFLLAACGKPDGYPDGPGEMPPTPVTIGTVETRELVEWEEFTGRVEATETVELRPRVSGYVTDVHFEAGTLVKAGEVLFTIDQRLFETKLRSARAEVARAEASETAAKREFERVEELLAARGHRAGAGGDARERPPSGRGCSRIGPRCRA